MKYKSPYINTTNNEVEVGETYAYSESSLRAFVSVLEDNSQNDFIALKLFVIKSNSENMSAGRIFEVSAANHEIVYPGMWRLWDADRFKKDLSLY